MAPHPDQTNLRRLVLVRHGETTGQSSIRYYGRTDIPLSADGIRQMETAREALRGERFDAVYTSELRRTIAGAQIIAPGTKAVALSDFNEINFGDWEGLTREEIRERHPEDYLVWQASRIDFCYPNGDTVSAFRERVLQAFRQLLPQMPQRSLMVVHRGIVSTILGELLRLSEDQRSELAIGLGSVHILRSHDDGWILESPGDLPGRPYFE